jgi:hypothetical protein
MRTKLSTILQADLASEGIRASGMLATEDALLVALRENLVSTS